MITSFSTIIHLHNYTYTNYLLDKLQGTPSNMSTPGRVSYSVTIATPSDDTETVPTEVTAVTEK